MTATQIMNVYVCVCVCVLVPLGPLVSRFCHSFWLCFICPFPLQTVFMFVWLFWSPHPPATGFQWQTDTGFNWWTCWGIMTRVPRILCTCFSLDSYTEEGKNLTHLAWIRCSRRCGMVAKNHWTQTHLSGIMEALPKKEAWTGHTPSTFCTVAFNPTLFPKYSQSFDSSNLFIVFC